jgi:hypothetical protein
MQSRRTERVTFLGEQDGVPERALKAMLSDYFSVDGNIQEAYLARVSFAEAPAPQVALCLRGNEETAPDLVDRVGRAFAKLFKTTEHLDILFLTAAQLTQITRVAKPFYPATTARDQVWPQ